MKHLILDYTFDPAGGTITFDIAEFDIRRLLVISNLKTGSDIYLPATPGFGYSALAGQELTLEADLDGMAADDPLLIYYEAPGGCSTAATFTPAATLHAAGDIIGTAQKIEGFAPPGGGEVWVVGTRLQVNAASVVPGEGGYEAAFYSDEPPSDWEDGDAWGVPEGDRLYYLDSVPMGAPVAKGGTLYVSQSGYLRQLTVPPDGSVWVVLVSLAEMTPGAVARTATFKTIKAAP